MERTSNIHTDKMDDIIKQRDTLMDVNTRTSILASNKSLNLITAAMNVLASQSIDDIDARVEVFEKLRDVVTHIKESALSMMMVRDLMQFELVSERYQ